MNTLITGYVPCVKIKEEDTEGDQENDEETNKCCTRVA